MDDNLKLLSRLYNAFDPIRPAEASEYVETSEVRGSAALAPYFIRRLILSRTGTTYLTFPFSGHIGGGKSSELNRLALCLRNDHATNGHRFLPIRLNVLDYFEDFSASNVEILLAMVSELGDTFRNDPELQIELNDSLITRRLTELKALLWSDVNVKDVEVSISGFKAKLSTISSDPSRRSEIRKALESEPGKFQEAMNSVFVEARLAARKKGFDDIVFLIDQLDRIERTPKTSDRAEAHKELFLDGSYFFADLNVHKVLTLPLSLVRAHGPQLALRYRTPPFVLPLIKIENRNHEKYSAGHQVFRELVKCRVTPLSVEQSINEDALAYLTKYSGGHPRYFLRFFMEALAESGEHLPVALPAAKLAIRGTVQVMVPSVHDEWWAKLVALELSSNQRVNLEDLDVRRMLDETMILEYLNGDVAANEFDDSAPWFAVHPILRELQAFKSLLAETEPKHEPKDGHSAPWPG